VVDKTGTLTKGAAVGEGVGVDVGVDRAIVGAKVGEERVGAGETGAGG